MPDITCYLESASYRKMSNLEPWQRGQIIGDDDDLSSTWTYSHSFKNNYVETYGRKRLILCSEAFCVQHSDEKHSISCPQKHQ